MTDVFQACLQTIDEVQLHYTSLAEQLRKSPRTRDSTGDIRVFRFKEETGNHVKCYFLTPDAFAIIEDSVRGSEWTVNRCAVDLGQLREVDLGLPPR